MAKEKINTLRGKRLVTGDPNLVTMNEIHVKDTSKGVEITERDKNGKLVNVTMPTGGGGDCYEYFACASENSYRLMGEAPIYTASILYKGNLGLMIIDATSAALSSELRQNAVGIMKIKVSKKHYLPDVEELMSNGLGTEVPEKFSDLLKLSSVFAKQFTQITKDEYEQYVDEVTAEYSTN